MSRKKATSKLFPDEEVRETVEEPIVDVDVDLSAIRKKRIRINGDNSKILDLNISDMNVATRLQVAYNKLNDMINEVREAIPDAPSEMTEEEQNKVLETLHDIDLRMREQVDYVFMAPVSEMCADDGSMWDPYEGVFRYEHIIEALLPLYENNLSSEFAKMRSNVDAQLQDHRKAVSKYHK